MRAYRAAIQEVEKQNPNGGKRPPDDMQETAQHLVRIAIHALMRMRDADWETAARCIKTAAATVQNVQNKKPALPSR